MAFIPVPNTCEVAIIYNVLGIEMVNTLGVEKATPWSSGDLDAVIGIVQAWYIAALDALQGDNVDVVAVRAYSLETATSPSRTDTTPMSGTLAQPLLPGNVSGTVTFQTDFRGRSFRGRNYILGLCENQVTNSVLESAVVTAYTSAYASLGADLLTDGPDFQHVVISRYSAGVPRVAGVTTPVTGYRCNAAVKTQRRRLT